MDVVNLCASLIILVNSILGLSFSGFIIFIHFSGSQEKTSFNLICLSRAINNVVVLLFDFLLLSFPVTLTSSNFYPINIESIIIITSVNLYLVNEFQSILISVNRFIAIFAPFHYAKLCGFKVTAMILFLIYAIRGYGVVKLLWKMFEANCEAYLSLQTFGTQYQDPQCWTTIPQNSDGTVIGTLFLFGITIVLNLMTFAKILKFYLSQHLDAESSAMARKNIRLFFQTILQDSLFFVDVLFTFKLSSLSSHRFWLFISTVFVWESIHTLDGLIMLMFSERLSLLKSKILRKSRNRVSGTSDFRPQTSNAATLPEIG